MVSRARVTVLADQPFVAESVGLALDREFDLLYLTEGPEAGSGSADITIIICPTGDQRLGYIEALADRRVVVVADTTNVPFMRDLLEMGIAGIVDHRDGLAAIVAAVRTTRAGHSAVPRQVLTEVMRMGRTRRADPSEPSASLTDRELEVLSMLARGSSTADIARQLYLSTNTVRSYVQAVLRKLETHSRLEAVVKARRLGMINHEPD